MIRFLPKFCLSASIAGAAWLLSFTFGEFAAAQQSLPPAIVSAPTYADISDLVSAAPVVVEARIKKATALPPERAPGLQSGVTRFYVQADVTALIRGSGGITESIRYLVDVPSLPKPRLKKANVILFGRQVPGRPGEFQLVAPDAQLMQAPGLGQQVRGIITEALDAEAAPLVTSVREAIHVPGNLLGEGETQIFLGTPRGDPVSLSVVQRPGMARIWGVSFSEIVDQSVRQPVPGTRNWYVLACFLPPALPDAALIGSTRGNADQAQADYRFILNALGPCQRNRKPPVGLIR